MSPQFSTRPTWPGGASAAVLITVEHDAEFLWYRLDPSVRIRQKTKSLGEYGPRRGVRRVLDTLERHGMPSTWFVPGAVAETHPDSVRAVSEAGHEIGARGWELESFSTLSPAEQEAALDRGAHALETVTGTRPLGFRGFDDVKTDTSELLLRKGYRWTSLLRGDDRPSYLGGDFSAARGLVDLPAPWELTDLPYFAFNYSPSYPTGQGRVAPYARVLADWKREFDAYRKHGGLYVLTVEPQSIGKPGRISILDELLDHIGRCDDVWVATAGQIAEHWRATVPGNDPGESERMRQLTVPGGTPQA